MTEKPPPSPPVPIEVRAVTLNGDRAAWWPLWAAYLSFYNTVLPRSVVDTTWSRLLDTAEPMWAALAWQGDSAVGLVHLIEHRSCWTVGNYLYLQDLFVAPEVRGQGVGQTLIAYAQQEAKRRSCSKLHWLTHESNLTAQALYDREAERSGFIQYRITP